MFARVKKAIGAVVAVGAVLALSAPLAQASPIDDGIRFKETFTFQDEGFADFLSFACGVPNVSVDVTEKINLWEGPNAVVGHIGYTTVVTNVDTGQYAVNSGSFHLDSTSTETLGDDGLLYVSITDTSVGAPFKWQAPGQGVIVRDAGTITFDIELIIDPSIDPEVADPVVGFSETFTSSGPHPWAEQGFEPTPEQGAAICGAIGG